MRYVCLIVLWLHKFAKQENVENVSQNGKKDSCAEACGTDEEGQESPQRD